MNKKLFAHFYEIGISMAVSGKGPNVYNKACEEVAPDPDNAHEYAFYFARQSMLDLKARNLSEWGKMGWLEWRIFRIRYWTNEKFKKLLARKKS